MSAPLIDRQALRAAVIRVVDDSLDKGALSPDWIVDAVLELARAVPTREQIEQAVREALGNSQVAGIVTEAPGPDAPGLETVIGDLVGWMHALLTASQP